MTPEELFYLSFSLSPIGPTRFQALLQHFKTAQNAWSATKEELKPFGIGEKTFEKFDSFRKSFDVKIYVNKLQAAKVEFVAQRNERYPKPLFDLPDPPICLYIKGNLNLLKLKNKTIGVVGTRKITSYGKDVTEKLVSELSFAGFTIVSGLAMGVDATAHRAALDANGNTIAVLGCGVDCAFPKENERLYEDILDNNSAIISEYPLGMQPNQGTFPARNRIIAALVEAVLVTEASEDSGSLITADWAQKLGKKVFAVPGPITSSQSKGTTQLLKSNANLVSSSQDILEELGEMSGVTQSSFDISTFQGSAEEKKVLTLLQDEALSMDELAKKSALSITTLSVLLSGLELKDIIKNQNNTFSLK